MMAPADRVNLLADNWALVEADRITAGGYFRLVEAVEDDRNRAVWEQVIRTVGHLDDLERGLSGRPVFQAYARSRLRPVLRSARMGSCAGRVRRQDDSSFQAGYGSWAA